MEYFKILSEASPMWVKYNNNPFVRYQDDASTELSEWLNKPIPANMENTSESQKALCVAADNYMLRTSAKNDHEMRWHVSSHAVKLERYFDIKATVRRDNFRDKLITNLRSIPGVRTTDLNAISSKQILDACKTVRNDKTKRLINELKQQLKKASDTVKDQFDQRGDQKLGTLLSAWPILTTKISDFLKESETIEANAAEADSVVLTKRKDDIIAQFQQSFSQYFDEKTKKVAAIQSDLLVFNYVLLERIDIENNISI